MKKKHIKATNIYKNLAVTFGERRAVKIVREAAKATDFDPTSFSLWNTLVWACSEQGYGYWRKLAIDHEAKLEAM